ncbi:MAG: fluoride efflux transporter CrcB, partial [Chloroflexota bacterium]
MTAVGLGGVLGANARYVLGTWAQSAWGTAFPWGTLLINVLGSLLIGVFLTLATERLTIRPATRLFIATGILGAFTTFSTMSYELVHLLQAGALLRAGLYLLASLGLGWAGEDTLFELFVRLFHPVISPATEAVIRG